MLLSSQIHSHQVLFRVAEFLAFKQNMINVFFSVMQNMNVFVYNLRLVVLG